MGRADARLVFGVVAAAHAALFGLLALGLRPRTEIEAPEVAVVPVYVAEIRRKPRPAAAVPSAQQIRGPRVLSRRADTAPVVTPPVISAAPAALPDSQAETQRLARALRGSRVGCANPALLSEAEQLACQDRLEQGSKLAKYIPTPLPPERRAFYDAVVKAKAPPTAGQIVQSSGSKSSPQGAGSDGIFLTEASLSSDRSALRGIQGAGPRIGCSLAFGGPKGTGGWRKPPHGLRLGPLPCYALPPIGPLSPEAGLQNPDTAEVKAKD